MRQIKSFSLPVEDINLIQEKAKELNISQAQVIRLGIQSITDKHIENFRTIQELVGRLNYG
ncbi:MAG: hypothetical protein RLZZ507_3758 [Cyanobacteriota bacterium]|jgi:hypothetical protein